MTSLSRVSILSEVVNLLRGGNISTGIECRASAGEAGVGDSQHLLGGDPTDDYGKDQGLLRDGLEREGGGGGEDEYVTIYASTRARVDGGRGGGSYPGEITGAGKIVFDEPSGSSSRFKAAEIAGSSKGSDSEPMAGASVKPLLLYAATFKFTRDDLSETALRRNIGEKGGIDNLTMEQYLALTRENQASGMVKPEIRGNVNFGIQSQFMRELREDTFSGNKNDDAHEHVERVLDIVSLFNIPDVSHNVVMMRVFPITLIGAANSCVDRLPPGTVDSCDLLKKALI
nr:hypothetical protein [Tanacetum cinerariifolium]